MRIESFVDCHHLVKMDYCPFIFQVPSAFLGSFFPLYIVQERVLKTALSTQLMAMHWEAVGLKEV